MIKQGRVAFLSLNLEKLRVFMDGTSMLPRQRISLCSEILYGRTLVAHRMVWWLCLGEALELNFIEPPIIVRKIVIILTELTLLTVSLLADSV